MGLDIEKVRELREAIRVSEAEQRQELVPKVSGGFVSCRRQNIAVGVTLDESDFDRMYVLAEEHGIQKAKFIRFLIHEYFKKWDILS
jgi:hypothetical protein